MTESSFTPRQLAFEKWRTMNGLTFMQVADKSGIPYSSLKSFTSKPGQGMIDRNVDKIASAFGVSAEDIFIHPALIGEDDGSGNRLMSVAKDSVVEIPEYDIKLSAGGGYIVDREDVKAKWSFGRDYISGELRLNPSTLSMVEIVGDSMSPTLFSGDRVLVNHDDTNVYREGIFAVWNGYATVAKRVEVMTGSLPPRLMLISDNTSHNQYEVSPDEIHVIGRIVWFARRM